MSLNEVKKDLLSQLLYEAQAYKKFEDIEKLVEGGMDLSMVPIQPLYVSLQSTTSAQIAEILPKLSEEQRQALRDIDFWQKDNLDPQAAYRWLEIYSMVRDEEVVLEYIKSEDFLLTMKNQFTIQTFDAEEPEYPEGNNYFITEDNQLLIEYPEDFLMVEELKQFMRRLYADIGVENAYAFLFKMVVDSYLIMEERIYQEKIERLMEFGFVDYFAALEYNSPFLSTAQIDAFIKSKKGTTGNLDGHSANQSLHASSLVPYQSRLDGIKFALDKITDEKRQHFLHFNFVRLVNARMTLDDALKHGSLAMGRVGTHTRQCLELGFEYILSRLDLDKANRIFEIFDFVDTYKVGHSLIEVTKRNIKKGMGETPFEKEDFGYFLGLYWNAFLENSHEEITKYKFDGSTKPMEINDLPSYKMWSDAANTFVTALPFIQTFFLSLEKLKSEGLLNDQFYLNYEVDNIDFEALMISSFINFQAGHYDESAAGKMGVTISELKEFYHKYFTKNVEEYLIKGEEDPILRQKLHEFTVKFGLHLIPGFEMYLYQVMVEQLNGYEVDGRTEEDFKHVGGPILLNYTNN
jgi:hypothetical protein